MKVNSINNMAFKGLSYSKEDAARVIVENYPIDNMQASVAQIVKEMESNFDRFAPKRNLELRFRRMHSSKPCFYIIDKDSYNPGGFRTGISYDKECYSYVKRLPIDYSTYEQYMPEGKRLEIQAESVNEVRNFADAAYKKFGIYDNVKKQSNEERVLNILL